MSKQPDKELRAELYELLKSDKRADTYVIPNRVMDIFVEYITKAQLQLVDELMEHSREYELTDIEKLEHWGETPLVAIPLKVLQQYKANLSGRGSSYGDSK